MWSNSMEGLNSIWEVSLNNTHSRTLLCRMVEILFTLFHATMKTVSYYINLHTWVSVIHQLIGGCGLVV